MLKSKRRKLLALIALVGLIVWLGSSALVVWQLTRRSGSPFPEPLPQLAGVQVEACRLQTADHQQLGAWLARADRHKGCVLLLHGIGASRQQMLPVMRGLVEAHYSALAVTLRAHGDSTGEINDFGWGARHDVVAGVQFLQRECPGQPVYVVGRSMGAAAAIFAAGDLKTSVAGYFLAQPYKDLSSATWNRVQNFLPPLLDDAAYLGLRLWGPVFLPVDPQRISPYEHVAEIPASVPVVFLAGSADRDARPEDVATLFAQVRSHARLVVFPGATHEALESNNPKLYWSSLLGLLDNRAGKSTAGAASVSPKPPGH